MSNIKGKLFLLIGPSGVGKGTVIGALKEKHVSDWVFPVSVTTREMRQGEEEGKTYFFYTKDKFKEEIK
ncbi:MAG: guanylate kinase, partial [Candidatus Gracilibacteria bacterium]|nr:guanylate kinase [Candidatus Gracilibacteria bacterium]